MVDLQNENEVKEYVKNLGIEYRFGCYSEKNPEVCHLLGDYMESIQKEPEKALKIYKANCDDSGYGRSCFQYGKSVMKNKKLSDKEKMEVAPPYFKKGCANGSADSCVIYGITCMTRSTADKPLYAEAVENFKKSCDMDHAFGCFQTCGMFLSGPKGVPKDMEQAYKYAIKACDLNDARGCANASIMCRKGEGTPQDLAKSEEFKKKAIEIQNMFLKDGQGMEFQRGL